MKTWYVLNHLAGQGHQITLVSFVRPEEEQYVAALRKLCSAVYAIPIRRSSAANIGFWLRSRFTGRPFLIERDDLAGMRQCVNELTQGNSFDFIHADQLSMAQFALPAPAWPAWSHDARAGAAPNLPVSESNPTRLIFDAHNAVWTIVARMSPGAPWYLQPLIRDEIRRVKRYEGMLVERFDHTFAVTEIDRQMLLAATDGMAPAPVRDPEAAPFHQPGLAERILVIPIAIDCHELRPIQRQQDTANIVTLGTLHYPPNADGIRWFAREVFPLVGKQTPGARLTIIGKNPPADFLELAEKDPQRYTVTGYVSDLTPYLEQSALMVVPVRAGSGMRVRILEAFARGMPVVTTSVGLEGIEAHPGRDVLVADTPAEFAEAVNRLLLDKDLQTQLAVNGRLLAESRYDWRIVLGRLDKVYGNIPA